MSTRHLASNLIFQYLHLLGLHSINFKRSFALCYQMFLLSILILNYATALSLMSYGIGVGLTTTAVNVIESKIIFN